MIQNKFLNFAQKISLYVRSHLRTLREAFNNQSHVAETRVRFFQALPFLFAALATGIAAILYAKAFQYVESKSHTFFETYGAWTLITTPILFVLSWALVEYLAPYASGSGIPQLMAAAEISQHDSRSKFIDRLLSVRIIVVKVVSSLLGVLGGGAMGREGPTLQIAGSLFHLTGKVLHKKEHSQGHHVLILAGGAAGLASA